MGRTSRAKRPRASRRDVSGRLDALSIALAAGCALVLRAGSAQAQAGRVEVASSTSLTPVGAGARAVGIGSAFVAVADDATAASWNPAGLVQLERPEISVVGVGVLQSVEFGSLDASDESVSRLVTQKAGDATVARLDYVSAALPGSWRGRNAIVSLNYQEMLAFDYALRDTLDERTLAGDVTHSERALTQDGAVYAAIPAVAFDLLPELSLGAAFNYWFDGLGAPYAWRNTSTLSTVDLSGVVTTRTQSLESVRFERFRGANATFGALWRPLEALSVGAVLKLPFHATSRRVLDTNVLVTKEPGGVTRLEGGGSAKVAFRFPEVVAGGIALRPSDAWLISVDATWVDWSYFRVFDSEGAAYLISADPAGTATIDAVTTVRAGVERTLTLPSAVLALRAGGAYDPQPARGAPATVVVGTAGIGLSLSRLSVDLAYEGRFGRDVGGTSLTRNIIGAPDAEVDLARHSLYLSLVCYL